MYYKGVGSKPVRAGISRDIEISVGGAESPEMNPYIYGQQMFCKKKKKKNMCKSYICYVWSLGYIKNNPILKTGKRLKWIFLLDELIYLLATLT